LEGRAPARLVRKTADLDDATDAYGPDPARRKAGFRQWFRLNSCLEGGARPPGGLLANVT